MSNLHNEEIKERLYEEAWEQIRANPPIPPYDVTDLCDYQEWLEEQVMEMVQKRWESDYA